MKIVKIFGRLRLLKWLFPDELEIADLSLILENNEDLKDQSISNLKFTAHIWRASLQADG